MSSIKFITPAQTIPVRHPVLREGKPIDSCVFAGDELATTFHMGYFLDEKLVGVVTLLENDYQDQIGKGFQLRGMAVLPEVQGMGVGKQLVAFSETEVLNRGGDYIWMNARIIAVPFYEKLCYTIISELFDIPDVGGHYRMLKKCKNIG